MSVINVLDKTVAELIAAGEVVERPSSIVKELLENSIDAGAKNISVEITGGGVRMIRISDDGCGISREDLPKAFLRHATSKVCEVSDLDSILTLGFRGEALASVAAMCRVEIVTKTAPEEEGTSYGIEGGVPSGCMPAGCPTGTTITVRDIFFNTPARMKFLKKDVAEGNSIAQVVDKCALSHPEIAFKFVRDGSVRLKTSGNSDLLAVIYAIHGREFANEMLRVDYVYEDFARVSGFISKPSAVKPSRSYQNFFINGRFVRTRTGAAALEEAYKTKIMGGKFPACFLNIELNAADVDVNVHPAKLEVRFVNEKPVFSSVYYAVKTALQKLETPLGRAPQKPTDFENRSASGTHGEAPVQQRITAREFRETSVYNAPEPSPQPGGINPVKPISFTYKSVPLGSAKIDISVDDDDNPGISRQAAVNCTFKTQSYRNGGECNASAGNEVRVRLSNNSSEIPVSGKKILDHNGKIYDENAVNSHIIDTITTGAETVPLKEEPEACEFRYIGELFGTYILLEQDDELVLLDKHAAHERILYERLKSGISYGNRQILLSAQSVSLSRGEHTALLENPEQVEKLGFLIEDFGGNSVLVREIPIELSEPDIAFILREIADNLKSHRHDLTPSVLDRLYYNIACRSAVKARDKSDGRELTQIARRLYSDPSITHCPHGRPVLIRLSRHDIEKKFGRLG